MNPFSTLPSNRTKQNALFHVRKEMSSCTTFWFLVLLRGVCVFTLKYYSIMTLKLRLNKYLWQIFWNCCTKQRYAVCVKVCVYREEYNLLFSVSLTATRFINKVYQLRRDVVSLDSYESEKWCFCLLYYISLVN